MLYYVILPVVLYLLWVWITSSVERTPDGSPTHWVHWVDTTISIIACVLFVMWYPLPWGYGLLMLPTYVVLVAWVCRLVTRVQYKQNHWTTAVYTACVCSLIHLALIL